MDQSAQSKDLRVCRHYETVGAPFLARPWREKWEGMPPAATR